MTENLKAFLAAAAKDKELGEKLKGAAPEAILALAKEKGFALTAEDLKEALSDDALEAVAGGVIYHRESDDDMVGKLIIP